MIECYLSQHKEIGLCQGFILKKPFLPGIPSSLSEQFLFIWLSCQPNSTYFCINHKPMVHKNFHLLFWTDMLKAVSYIVLNTSCLCITTKTFWKLSLQLFDWNNFKFACIAISEYQWIPSPIQGRAHEFWMTSVGENMASLKNLKSS